MKHYTAPPIKPESENNQYGEQQLQGLDEVTDISVLIKEEDLEKFRSPGATPSSRSRWRQQENEAFEDH